MQQRKQLVRGWTRAQARAGRSAATPVALLGLAGVALAVGQAWCVAALLAAGLSGVALPWDLAAAFAVAAVLRAALALAADQAALRAGAAARMRLRAEALARILAAGPALLREGMV